MTKPRQHGFTLVELILFIVIVGVGVAGVLSIFTTAVKSSADPMVRKQSIAIAESLLEEILLKEYKDPNGGSNGVTTCTLASGTNRALWDDVCDYNGYATTGGIKELVSGNAVSNLSAYNIAPAVVVGDETIDGVPVKQITVSVTSSQGTVSLKGYRGNF